MIMFRSSGTRILNGRLGCVCSFPSFEEWEEQRCAGQRARVAAAAAARGRTVWKCSQDHSITDPAFSSLFYVMALFLLVQEVTSLKHKPAFTQQRHYQISFLPNPISREPFCLLESLTTAVLFYHFIQAAGGSSGTEECLSEVNTTAHRVDTRPF